MLSPSEVELTETVQKVLAAVERIKPTRMVFDSLSELRLLAQSSLRYRRQILALKQFFVGRKCTVILLDDLTAEGRICNSTALPTASYPWILRHPRTARCAESCRSSSFAAVIL